MKETDFVLLQRCLEIEAESKPPGFAAEKAITHFVREIRIGSLNEDHKIVERSFRDFQLLHLVLYLLQ